MSNINIDVEDNNSNNNYSNRGVPPKHNGSGTYVNKWMYIIIAFFFGGFGLHRAYAGKPWIMRLLFSWTGIPLIMSIFNILNAIFQSTDAYGRILVY